MPRLLGLSLPVWLCGGGAVLFAASAGVTGGLALAKHSDYEKANTGLDPAAADKLKRAGEGLNIATDVLLGASLLSVGAGLTLFFLDGGPSRFTMGGFVPSVGPTHATLRWHSIF